MMSRKSNSKVCLWQIFILFNNIFDYAKLILWEYEDR